MSNFPKIFWNTIRCLLIFIILQAGLLTSPAHSVNPPLRVHFIDVGYGDSILIQLPNKKMILIDAGDKEHGLKLMEYLANLGIKEIDVTILTHPHDNHFGGYFSLIQEMKIGAFLTNGDDQRADEGYDELISIFQEKGIPISTLVQGNTIDGGSGMVLLKVLHPENLERSVNENSLVIRLQYGEVSFIFTGDIQLPQQDQLIDQFPEIQKAAVFQAPHHGGVISSRLAEYLTDKIFVVSTGTNDYGKPYEQHLQQLQGRILRTDQLGSIILESDGKTVQVMDEH